MTDTKKMLAEMLTQNTGTHFLDSGGQSGRNFQQNAGVNFEAQPASTYKAYIMGNNDDKLDLVVTHNVYHWLAERVEYDAELQAAFAAWCCQQDTGNLSAQHALREALCDGTAFGAAFDEPSEEAREGRDRWLAMIAQGVRGLHRSGDPMLINTYNGECALSQVLQYLYFECDGTAYVCLSIHGGADVRGGYTDPVIFEVTGDECSMFDNARAGLWSTTDEPDPPSWYSDNAGSVWCANDAEDDLDRYTATNDPALRGSGEVYVDDDGVAYCPVTGAKLEVGFY